MRRRVWFKMTVKTADLEFQRSQIWWSQIKNVDLKTSVGKNKSLDVQSLKYLWEKNTFQSLQPPKNHPFFVGRLSSAQANTYTTHMPCALQSLKSDLCPCRSWWLNKPASWVVGGSDQKTIWCWPLALDAKVEFLKVSEFARFACGRSFRSHDSHLGHHLPHWHSWWCGQVLVIGETETSEEKKIPATWNLDYFFGRKKIASKTGPPQN